MIDNPALEPTRGDSTSGEAPAARSLPSRSAALSGILRAIGAGILLSSASAFLFQGWATGNDLARYAALFGLTAVLAAAALVCGVAIREGKAARTLLAVALAMVPVHAAVLGALLYSRFAWDSTIGGRVPAFGVWVAPSDPAALLVAAGGLTLLLPIVYLAARALVPPLAVRLAAAVAAVNLPLLLPVRDPDATALMVAASTAALLGLELRWTPREPSLRTFEGRLVRLLLAVPALIALGRAHLYDPTPALLHGIALLCLAATMFALARRLSESEAIVDAVELVTLAPAAMGWYLVTTHLPGGPTLLWLTLPPAAVLLGLSTWSARGGRNYRRIAAGVAVTGAAGHQLLDPGVGASLICLGVGIAAFGYGFYVRQKLILAAGLAGGALGLVHQVRYALEIFDWSRWGSLAVVGLSTVLAAALLERYQEQALSWAAGVGRRIHSWRL